MFIAIPMLAVTASFMMLVVAALALASPRIAAILAAPEAADEAGRSIWTALTTIVGMTLVPAVEEFAFRGVLLNLWAERYGLRRAVVASALVFGVLHLDIVGLRLRPHDDAALRAQRLALPGLIALAVGLAILWAVLLRHRPDAWRLPPLFARAEPADLAQTPPDARS